MRLPTLPSGFVARPRLSAMLDDDRTLTLVAAPAGSGKTALLAAWAREQAGAIAWLPLDAAARERRTFWGAALAALRQCGVDAAAGERADLLVDAVERHADRVVLILDDLHELNGSAVMVDLDRLLRHPPANLRVLAATRADPPLRLQRLRLAGELAEVRARDLAFTGDEAAALAAAERVRLGDDDLERLWLRTEGWAAGLRLAFAFLRDQPDPAEAIARFAGDDATVADYLVGEILSQLDDELRDFLLRISVTGTAGAELAGALTGRPDAARLLTALERQGALVTPLAGRGGWCRIHPLFAELLRAELRRTLPGEPPELHRRAAAWYADEGDLVAAVRHAVAAGSPDVVEELLARSWVELMVAGTMGTLRPLLDAVPHERLSAEPELALACAVARLDAGERRAAKEYLELAGATAERVPAARRDRFEVMRAAVGLHLGRLDGDPAAALDVARPLLLAEALEDGTERDAVRAHAYANLGMAELWTGDLDAAGHALLRARAAAARGQESWLLLLASALLALRAELQGRLDASERAATEALELAAEREWSGTWAAGVAHMALAAVQLHWNRLDEAEVSLARAERSLHGNTDPPLRAMLAHHRAGLLAASGDPEAALRVVQTGLQELDRWPLATELRGLLVGREAVLLAAVGRAGSAHRLLDETAGSAAARVAAASLRLAAGEPGAAREALLPFTAAAPPEIGIEGWIVQALAADAQADHDGAADALERALAAAAPSGYRRPLVGHGRALAPVLRRHLAHTAHRELAEEVLATIDGVGTAERAPRLLADRLSDRELIVLRYLPTMLSNQEIAAELYVSVNTVKTHLKSIYRKLDAGGRRDAVDRARRLQLLAP